MKMRDLADSKVQILIVTGILLGLMCSGQGMPACPGFLPAPTITSEPLTSGVVGQEYRYAASADSSAPVTWSLQTAPSGMTIDSASGLLKWLPAEPDVGDQPVELTASNLAGETIQAFVITVGLAPRITSPPNTHTAVNSSYLYQPEAIGTLPWAWQLISGPESMNIDRESGIVTWFPGPGDEGSHFVKISLTNHFGADSQEFSLTVGADTFPPEIVSEPVLKTKINQLYQYQGAATGTKPISWSLASAPQGMTLDSVSGLISWTPAKTGSFWIVFNAENSFGSDTQYFSLEVTAN
jgi:hypothetical protein